jgi:shikimate dehydrogenase
MSSPAVQPLLALLASHVASNPTQYMFEKAFAHHDLDWRYLTFEVTPEGLGDAVRGLRALGFRGGHCADPHKQAVLSCLGRTTETAALIGAVNLFFREDNALVGDNTEGKGLLQMIRSTLDPAGKRIVLLGAGRMARAIAVELATAGAASITIVNRTEAHAAEIVAILADKFTLPVAAVAWQDDYAIPVDTDILIHATSLGHAASDTPLPLVLDSLRPELLVADVTMTSTNTWLLAEAAERGCKTVDGLTSLIERVAIGFQMWTAVDPDRQVLREAVEEFLEL